MVQRDGGTVTILDRDSRTASVRSKEEIGVVLGSDGIPQCLNAVQAGKVMAGIYRNWDAGDYAELCRKSLVCRTKKQYKDYSTGMKMKLCIAVALAHHPKAAAVGRSHQRAGPGGAGRGDRPAAGLCPGRRTTPSSFPPTLSATWKSCAIPSPFLHKGSRLLLCEEKDALREEYALWHGTAAQLAALDTPVYGKRVTPTE